MYLINCEVIETRYMSDKDNRYEMNHIVDALSEKDAEEKLRNHYEKMNNEWFIFQVKMYLIDILMKN